MRLRTPGLSITLYVIQEEKVNSITVYLLQASRVLKCYRDNKKAANIEILWVVMIPLFGVSACDSLDWNIAFRS